MIKDGSMGWSEFLSFIIVCALESFGFFVVFLGISFLTNNSSRKKEYNKKLKEYEQNTKQFKEEQLILNAKKE